MEDRKQLSCSNGKIVERVGVSQAVHAHDVGMHGLPPRWNPRWDTLPTGLRHARCMYLPASIVSKLILGASLLCVGMCWLSNPIS